MPAPIGRAAAAERHQGVQRTLLPVMLRRSRATEHPDEVLEDRGAPQHAAARASRACGGGATARDGGRRGRARAGHARPAARGSRSRGRLGRSPAGRRPRPQRGCAGAGPSRRAGAQVARATVGSGHPTARAARGRLGRSTSRDQSGREPAGMICPRCRLTRAPGAPRRRAITPPADVDFIGNARPYSRESIMPTTLQQHREALSGHADRLARYQRGEIAADSWRPIRLSYGLYYQLDHTSHMQRIKIPGGLLTAEQLDVMADVADRYGRGIAHVTTRQDIQIHWVPLEQIIDMYERLLAVDITTRGACADSVRNVTGCPYAGVHPDEPFDVAPYVLAVHDYFLFNPLNLTLPRKFKIAVEGCPEDCAQVPVNDIGLYASAARRGARVRGLGRRRPRRAALPRQADRRLRPGRRPPRLVRGDRAGAASPRRAQEPQPRAHEVRGEEDGPREASGSSSRSEVRGSTPSAAPSCARRCATTSRGTRPRDCQLLRKTARRSGRRLRRTGGAPTSARSGRTAIGRSSCSCRWATSRRSRCAPSPTSSRDARQRDAARHQRPEPRPAVDPRAGAAGRAAAAVRHRAGRRRRGHASTTSSRARGWTTARSPSRARWAWRSGCGRTCSTIRRAATASRRDSGRFTDQGERLPELLRPAPHRRHRAHRPLGERAGRDGASVLLDPGRRLGRARDGAGSASVSGAIARRIRRRPSPPWRTITRRGRQPGESFPAFVDRVGTKELSAVASGAAQASRVAGADGVAEARSA